MLFQKSQENWLLRIKSDNDYGTFSNTISLLLLTSEISLKNLISTDLAGYKSQIKKYHVADVPADEPCEWEHGETSIEKGMQPFSYLFTISYMLNIWESND